MEYLNSQNFAVKFIQDLIPELIQIKQEATNPNTPIQRLFELAQISKEMARLVANNLGATPQLLQSLSTSNDAETRQNVIANPNTPTDVLLSLGSEFPKQLLNNPIFSLLWLENPNLIDEIPPRTLRNILKEETVPSFLLELAVNKQIASEIQLALTINHNTPKNILENLLNSAYPEVRTAAMLHVNMAGEIKSGWHKIALQEISNIYLDSQDKQHANYLYRNSSIPKLVILQLVEHHNADIRSLIASHPNTSIKLLEKLALDQDNRVRYYVASNPNIPIKLLEKLALDQDAQVRYNVASNPNTTIKLLEHLALDQDNFIRQNVASNPNILIKLLEKLALDQDDQVRYNVASNPNIPIKLLEHLALDEADRVRYNVASHPNTPAHILEKLATDQNYLVRQGIAFNSKTPAKLLVKLAQDDDKYVRGYVASHRHTPIDILERLAQDEDKYVQKYVASNPNTPIKLLEKFAGDPDQIVREKLADNPRLPAYLLKELTQNPNKNVRRHVAAHPKGNVLNQLVQDYKTEFNDSYNFRNTRKLLLTKKLKYEHEKCKPCFIRFLLFLQPKLSPKILAENSRSLAWLERYAIAQNPHTPIPTIKALARDGNRVVRAAAKANLKSRQSQI